MTLSIQEQIALDKALDRLFLGDDGSQKEETSADKTAPDKEASTKKTAQDKLGDVAKMCLNAGLTQTQMNGLETLGHSARRFGELEAYVMRQTGKDRNKKTWAKPSPSGRCLGQEMLVWLGSLRDSADQAYLAVVQVHPALGGERGAEAKNAFRLRVASACLRDLNSVFMYQALQGSSSSSPPDSKAVTSSSTPSGSSPQEGAPPSPPKKGGRK